MAIKPTKVGRGKYNNTSKITTTIFNFSRNIKKLLIKQSLTSIASD